MSEKTIRVPLLEPGMRPELNELEAQIMAERGRIPFLRYSSQLSDLCSNLPLR